MTLDEFIATIPTDRAPDAPLLLQAMWHDAKGDWHRAHAIAQSVGDASGAWVHGYLHRKEGDIENAGYWYRQAGQPIATDSLEAEWRRIVLTLLEEREGAD